MSYGKTGRGLEAGGAVNIARKMPAPLRDIFTRTDSGYWVARAGGIPSHTPPKLWGSIPVELYEEHHTDPVWDVRRNQPDGLGLMEWGSYPGSSTVNRMRHARAVREELTSYGPYFQQGGVVPASGKQPSAADVVQDLPPSVAGLDWPVLLGLGVVAYWFLRR